MINDKLKLVLLLTFLGAIVLAGITGISASSDTNDTTTGTSNTIKSISLITDNTSEISSSNLLTSESLITDVIAHQQIVNKQIILNNWYYGNELWLYSFSIPSVLLSFILKNKYTFYCYYFLYYFI